MRISLVAVKTDIENWPAVAACLSLVMFMGIVVAVTLNAPVVVIAILSSLGAAASGAAWIDSIWEGYKRSNSS